MNTLLIIILGGVANLALMVALGYAARRSQPVSRDDSLVFRYPPLLRWGSLCAALAAPLAVTGVCIAHPPEDQGDIIAIVLSYAMFMGLTGALLWDTARLRVVVGPDGIECRSPWRRRQLARWADVADVSFNNPTGWFEVRTTDGRAIRVSALLGGLEAFLQACEQRLAPSQLEPARLAYAYLGRAFPGDSDLF